MRDRGSISSSSPSLDPALAPAIVFVPRLGAQERETATRTGHKNPLSTLFHAKIYQWYPKNSIKSTRENRNKK